MDASDLPCSFKSKCHNAGWGWGWGEGMYFLCSTGGEKCTSLGLNIATRVQMFHFDTFISYGITQTKVILMKK